MVWKDSEFHLFLLRVSNKAKTDREAAQNLNEVTGAVILEPSKLLCYCSILFSLDLVKLYFLMTNEDYLVKCSW